MDNRDFVTLAMMSVKHSVVHKPQEERSSNRARKLGPPDLSIASRSQGAVMHLCGDSNVADKWINGHDAMGKRYKENMAVSQNVAFVVEWVN